MWHLTTWLSVLSRKTCPSTRDFLSGEKIFHERLLERGVRIGIKNEYEMRAVTHLDVDPGEIAQAADAVAQVAAAA